MERPNKPTAIPVSPVAPTPQVSISDDSSRVTATLPTGERVEILLYGATVISWKSASGKENLFLSSKAHLDGSKAVRGGIPLVFPVFGKPIPDHPTGQLTQHGFARTSRWEYLGKSTSESSKLLNSSGDSSVKLDFGLSDSVISNAEWDYQFALTYSVTLSSEDLETSMVVRNTGSKNYDFQVLFHSYFTVDDISIVKVTGLEEASFVDKVQGGKTFEATSKAVTFDAEVDRIYTTSSEQPVTVVEGGKGRYQINRDTLPDVVVWNPWEAKSKSMADLGPECAYHHFLCVEAGSVSKWNSLEAGDSWEGGQRIKAL